MAGAITSTYEGTFLYDDPALLTELDTLSTEAATAKDDINSIKIVYVGEGKVAVYKLDRAA